MYNVHVCPLKNQNLFFWLHGLNSQHKCALNNFDHFIHEGLQMYMYMYYMYRCQVYIMNKIWDPSSSVHHVINIQCTVGACMIAGLYHVIFTHVYNQTPLNTC